MALTRAQYKTAACHVPLGRITAIFGFRFPCSCRRHSLQQPFLSLLPAFVHSCPSHIGHSKRGLPGTLHDGGGRVSETELNQHSMTGSGSMVLRAGVRVSLTSGSVRVVKGEGLSFSARGGAAASPLPRVLLNLLLGWGEIFPPSPPSPRYKKNFAKKDADGQADGKPNHATEPWLTAQPRSSPSQAGECAAGEGLCGGVPIPRLLFA